VLGLFRSFVSMSSFASGQEGAHTPAAHLMIQGSKAMLTYRYWYEPQKRQIQISRCAGRGDGGPEGALPLETIAVPVNPDGVAVFHDVVRLLLDKLVVSHRSGKAAFCSAADNIQSLAAIKALEASARRDGEPVEVATLLEDAHV